MIMPGMKIKIPSGSKQVKTNRYNESDSQLADYSKTKKKERNAQSANRPMAKDLSDVDVKNFPKRVISPDHIPEYPLNNVSPNANVTVEKSDKDLKKGKSPIVHSLRNQENFFKGAMKENKMLQQEQQNKTVKQHKQMMPNMEEEVKRRKMQMMQQPMMQQPMMQQPMMQQPMMQQPMMQQPMMQPQQMDHHYGYCCCCLQPLYRPDSPFMHTPCHRRGPMFGGPVGPSYTHDHSKRKEY